jgi:hypothetical protein
MAQSSVPRLVEPRSAQIVDMVRSAAGGFDADAWHIMNERDNALIADEILNGAGSSTFVYDFEIQGKRIVGVSVIGARHLAAHYKGLKHRLVAAMQKNGAVFTFTSYPAENLPMAVSCSVVQELSDEADFYSAVVELVDVKSGNTIQVERREARQEFRRDGTPYERPNYATIAQSKAYRNAVLALVPQDVVIRWRDEMLKLKKGETITGSVLDEKRSQVLRFAAQKAIALDRHAVERLTLDQIAGLGDAAREGALPAFVNSAKALGLDVEVGHEPTESGQAAASTATAPAVGAPQARRGRGRPPGPRHQQAPAPSAGEGDDDAGVGDAPQRPQQRRVNFEV